MSQNEPPFRVVVPSRRRTSMMEKIQGMLPNATIVVDRDEEDEYAKHVDADRLVTHPGVPNYGQILNWCLDTFTDECIVFIDDDLEGVRPLIGKNRLITNADDIESIIWNGFQCCSDLGLGVFCWQRTMNRIVAEPDYLPFKFTMQVCNSFGLMNAARDRRTPAALEARIDLDMTLQALLYDRIVLCDCRWYFDHGRMDGNPGGMAGRRTPQKMQRATQWIVDNWGDAIDLEGKAMRGINKGRNQASRVGIRVESKNRVIQEK